MKNCQFCGNEIQDVAIKCKHCKNWLQESTENQTLPKKAEIKKKDNKIFYIVGGVIALLVLCIAALSLRYEEVDYERYRFRYDRFTKTVYVANIALVAKPGGDNKTNLWHKTQYASLQQAISEQQRIEREDAAHQQRRAMEDAADEQRRAIENSAQEQRRAIEDAADELKRQQDDIEFLKMMRRR